MASTIVLIHGGQHTARCWDLTVAAIHARRPEAKVQAVNLPGHGDEPGDLASLTIDQCVASVVRQIRATSPQQVLLVGHSMAGITLPGVAAELGRDLVQRAIFVACCVPPQGKTVLDTLQPPMSWVAKYLAKKHPQSPPLPAALARWVFANGMDRAGQQLVVDNLCAESTRVTREAVDRSHFPKLPMSWVLPLRDRAVRPALQRRFMANLGGVEDVVAVDTCHDIMISEPDRLAEILLQRC